jgi:hypothetical protein
MIHNDNSNKFININSYKLNLAVEAAKENSETWVINKGAVHVDNFVFAAYWNRKPDPLELDWTNGVDVTIIYNLFLPGFQAYCNVDYPMLYRGTFQEGHFSMIVGMTFEEVHQKSMEWVRETNRKVERRRKLRYLYAIPAFSEKHKEQNLCIGVSKEYLANHGQRPTPLCALGSRKIKEGTRFCGCEEPWYAISTSTNKGTGEVYETRQCKTCGHYWEGQIGSMDVE